MSVEVSDARPFKHYFDTSKLFIQIFATKCTYVLIGSRHIKHMKMMLL